MESQFPGTSLSLLEADGEAKLTACVCQVIHQSLKGLFRVGRHGVVVSKEGLPDGDASTLVIGRSLAMLKRRPSDLSIGLQHREDSE